MEIKNKITVIEVTLIIILLLFLLCYHYEDIASYFYGPDIDNKGKLLATILTAIGGICVIWGLYLNNKKIAQQIRQVNEQVRQNDISVQNSNDKRFGEAIGYLNDDNEGIVIGGIYALYQLAKEDKRYAPIITNIFCNYINENTNKQHKRSFQTILHLLFSIDNPFVFENTVELNNIKIENAILYCNWANIKFTNCTFSFVSIKETNTLRISNCNLSSLSITEYKELYIFKTKSTYSLLLETDNNVIISILDSIIEEMEIDTKTSDKYLKIECCELNSLINIYAYSIMNLIIKRNENHNASINISVEDSILGTKVNDISLEDSVINEKIDDTSLVHFLSN